MADSTSAGAIPPVIIDKRGDVVLKVGEEPGEVVNLLVSSKVLSLASKVFEAMFNSGFAEGQNFSSTTPYELPLPDDDARHMTTICRLVHMQTNEVSEKMPIADLATFATLCDKYDCTEGIRGWSKVWLSCYGPHDAGYPVLLTISYLLDLPQEFRNISQGLIRHHVSITEEDILIDDQAFLPSVVISRQTEYTTRAELLTVLGRLSSDQSRLQQNAGAALFSGKALVLLDHSDSSCERSRQAALHFVQNLRSSKLLPIQALTLAQYLERTTVLKGKPLATNKAVCYNSNCLGDLTLVQKEIFEYIQALFNSAHGYCLDCVNNAVSGTEKAKCRIIHDPDPWFEN